MLKSERSVSILFCFLVFCMLAAVRLAGTVFIPVTTDEAYYFLWSRHIDLGYFDHPPVIAWLSGWGSRFVSGVLGFRLGGYLLQMALFPIYLSLCRKAGLTKVNQLTTAALLMFFNFLGCMVGIVATPDTPFFFAWTLALLEAATALEGKRWRWLTAGAATAFGLWSKYALLLIGPVFLWALVKKRENLKSPWPYLGGGLCLLLLLPHLYWNAQNGWVSLKFQFNHGVMGSYETSGLSGSDLPRPLAQDPDSKEFKLGEYFLGKVEPAKPQAPLVVRVFHQVSDFLGGQICLWGFLLVPFFPVLWRNRWRLKAFAVPSLRRGKDSDCVAGTSGQGSLLAERAVLSSSVKDLCRAGAVVPLIVFGVLSFFQRIEANWPAIYTVTASIALVTYLPLKRRWVVPAAAAANLWVILALIWHASHPFWGAPAARDRVVVETHGYDALAKLIAEDRWPVLADSYQLVSMLTFYEPEMKIMQWPGITRYSELTRRRDFADFHYNDLLASGKFRLITLEIIPPRLPGFTADKLTEVKDCPRIGLRFTSPPSRRASYIPPCKNAIHRWFLVDYRRSSGAEASR